MKLSRDEFRDLTRNFLTEVDETSDNLRLISEVTPGERAEALRLADADALRSKMQGMQGHSKNTNDWVEMLGQLIDQDMTERGLVSYKEEGAAVIEALEILRREIKDEMRGPTR